MPAGRRSKKVPIYFRVSPGAAERIRQFLADYAGKPLFLKPGEWAESVLLQAIAEVEEHPPETPQVAGAGSRAQIGVARRDSDNHHRVAR